MLIPNKYLKELRLELGLNQKDLAEILQMTQANYSDIERGKTLLNIKDADTLHRQFNADISKLIGEQLSPQETTIVYSSKKHPPRKTINSEIKKRLIKQVKIFQSRYNFPTYDELSPLLLMTPSEISQIMTISRSISIDNLYKISICIPEINLDYTIRGIGEILNDK